MFFKKLIFRKAYSQNTYIVTDIDKSYTTEFSGKVCYHVMSKGRDPMKLIYELALSDLQLGTRYSDGEHIGGRQQPSVVTVLVNWQVWAVRQGNGLFPREGSPTASW